MYKNISQMKNQFMMALFFFATFVYSKNIFHVAKKVERNASKLGLQVAIIGVILAGGYFVFGRQDAGEKFSKAILGTLIIATATGIVATLKAWI